MDYDRIFHHVNFKIHHSIRWMQRRNGGHLTEDISASRADPDYSTDLALYILEKSATFGPAARSGAG
jgi:hypothetical protein